MILVAQLIALIVLALIGAGMALAASGRRGAARAAQAAVPAPPMLPPDLVDAGGPEDALRRRLRRALAALRSGARLDDAELFEARLSFERHAVTVDERLIAVARLPHAHRAAPLARVSAAVEALEQAAAALDATRPVSDRASRLDAAMIDVDARVARLSPPAGIAEQPQQEPCAGQQ